MEFDLFGGAYHGKTEALGVPYMGSKRKYADALICKMLEIKPNAKYFYDLFGGGGAMSFAAMQKGMTVFYNEKHESMAGFMQFIFECCANPKSEYGIFPPEYYEFITREKFMMLRDEFGNYAQFARIVYSFGNKQTSYLFNPELEKLKHLAHNFVVFRCVDSLNRFNELTGADIEISDKKAWNERRLDFSSDNRRAAKRFDLQRLEQLEQLERLEQLEQLERAPVITSLDYRLVKIETPINETLVYLDPPYCNTAKYVEDFDYNAIDDYFKNLPYLAFMSEYEAPFKCVHEIQTRSTLSQKNSTPKIEKLYINKL